MTVSFTHNYNKTDNEKKERTFRAVMQSVQLGLIKHIVLHVHFKRKQLVKQQLKNIFLSNNLVPGIHFSNRSIAILITVLIEQITIFESKN